MDRKLKIVEVELVDAYQQQLSELLVSVVDDGASVGFLPPLSESDAAHYWTSVLAPGVILFIAEIDHDIAGSIQLQLCKKQNGSHRAEIAKLMTSPKYRRMGIGRALMNKAEERAKEEGIRLLVLDTREGDPSNHLYRSIGFIEAGRIPGYALSANGSLDASVFYYKSLVSNE
ncbi:GNAT family N-acetyltransferase [Peribacillus sp. SCS-155]|uniref:GNAT family N-acetyltransferase n=1 Tax=Peribacillus sedimenti TaxID=3115297 RepID=UPI003906AC05